MYKKAIFTLGNEFFVYDEDAEGNAVGDPLTKGLATVEEAQAELARLEAAPTAPPAKPTKTVVVGQEVGQAARVSNDIAALKNQVTALQTQLATNLKAAAGVTEIQLPIEKQPFKNLGAAMRAVKEASRPGGEIHPRLKFLDKEYTDSVKAITGASESSPAGGGFLLEPTIASELLLPMRGLESSPFISRARKLPVGPNSNAGWINGVNETDRADGSRWGGIRGYRINEAGQKTASAPKFKRLTWELKEYAVLMYATDNLLNDTTQLQTVFTMGASEELAFMANDDALNGLGTGGPLGVLNANLSVISVSKSVGQAAATVTNTNIIQMYQRMHPKFRANACWCINSEVEPQLDLLSIPAGAGALEPRYVTYGPDGVMRIKGKPVIVTEFNAALGTVGDILLCNWQDYLFWEKDVQTASSIHLRFDYDETVFRVTYRCDGLPATPALTPYKGSNTQSAFVVLATRS